MLKIKLGHGRDVMEYPRKAVPQILQTYSVGNSNKYFSCHFDSKKKEILKDSEVKSFENLSILSIETVLYTLTYSEFHKNTRTIQMLNSVQRTFGLCLDLPAFGYVVYFDAADKAIRVTFYFVNKQVKTDKVYSKVPSELLPELYRRVDERIHSFGAVSRTREELTQLERKLNAEKVEYLPEPSDEVSKRVYDLAMLATDPVMVQAIHRACRGLDMARAEKLLDSMNALITINGDTSIDHIALPKGMQRKKKGHQSSKQAPSQDVSVEPEALSDVFDI